MKTSIVILLFVTAVATNSAKAQTTVPGAKETTAEGSVARPVSPGYSEDEFTGSIGPHYAGNDLREIYQVLESRLSPKGEYEKTSEYEDRLRRAMNEPIAGSLRPNGLLAFVFKPQRRSDSDLTHPYLSYDADKEQMIVNMSPVEDDRINAHHHDDEISEAIIWEKGSRSRSYEGSNAFGASTEVTSINQERYALLYDVSIMSHERPSLVSADGMSDSGEVRFHLPVAQAKVLSDRLRVLIVCSIKEAPVANGYAYNAPTISDPIEIAIKDNYLHVSLDSIWVFDDETGKVYVKSTDAISSLP
jgi:hypothetical protein